jgi:hypothetical protein
VLIRRPTTTPITCSPAAGLVARISQFIQLPVHHDPTSAVTDCSNASQVDLSQRPTYDDHHRIYEHTGRHTYIHTDIQGYRHTGIPVDSTDGDAEDWTIKRNQLRLSASTLRCTPTRQALPTKVVLSALLEIIRVSRIAHRIVLYKYIHNPSATSSSLDPVCLSPHRVYSRKKNRPRYHANQQGCHWVTLCRVTR